MDTSIADELYSEVLKVPNIELDPMSNADNAIQMSYDSDEHDLWYDDGALDDKTEKMEKATDMEREWLRRREQFHTIGYRDGLTDGKKASAQEGFNMGFMESVFVGKTWGLVRGVTSALARLPNGLKERLVETEDKRNKLQHLHESVRGISTTDALKLFHDLLNNKLTEHGVNNKLTEHGENAETTSDTEDLHLHGKLSDENVLEHYVQEFNLLLVECSAIIVHLG